jgi:hypothetical protein
VVVNCPEILHPRSNARSLYGVDTLHYNPTLQEAAGMLISSVIIAADDPTPQPLPAPIVADVLFPAKVIDFANPDHGVTETFSNSAVQAGSLKISPGGHLSIELPGRLVAISFISRPDSGSFQMTMNDRSAVVHTLHRDVRDGLYKFLPLSALGDWWEGPNEPGLLTIDTLYTAAEKADWPIFHVGPPPGGGGSVYLHQALVRAD